VCHNVGYDGHGVGAGGKRDRGPFGGDAADGHEGAFEPFAPGGEAWKALRFPRHFLERGGVDRPQRHVIRIGGQGGIQLLITVGADADPHAGAPNGGKIGARQVLLAEMHEVRSRCDGLAPIVVDHELAAMVGAQCDRLIDPGAHGAGRPVLDAELRELDALGQEASQPISVGNDGIEWIEVDHEFLQDAWSILKKGVPATGVEGEPMSRGSTMPASNAIRPA